MTAINALVSDDGQRGWMLTDTMCLDAATGVFAHQFPKVITVPHALMAISASGPLPHCMALCSSLSLFSAIDQITSGTNLSKAYDAIAAQHGMLDHGVSVAIMGWSFLEKRMRILSADKDMGFQIQRAKEFAQPGLEGFRATACKRAAPAAYLLEKMHTQREQHTRNPADNSCHVYSVGGMAVLTEIDETGIRQSVEHIFGDRLGQKPLHRRDPHYGAPDKEEINF